MTRRAVRDALPRGSRPSQEHAPTADADEEPGRGGRGHPAAAPSAARDAVDVVPTDGGRES